MPVFLILFSTLFFFLNGCGQKEQTQKKQIAGIFDLKKNLPIFMSNGEEIFFHSLEKEKGKKIFSLQGKKNIKHSFCHSPTQAIQYENKIFVSCSLSHKILILKAENFSFLGTIWFQDKASPQIMAIDPKTQQLFVSGYNTNSLYWISLQEKNFGEILHKENLLPSQKCSTQCLARPSGVLVFKNFLIVALSNLHKNYNLSQSPNGEIAIFEIESKKLYKREETSYKNAVNLLIAQEKLYVANRGDYTTKGSLDIFTTSSWTKEKTIELKGFFPVKGIEISPKTLLWTTIPAGIITLNLETQKIQKRNLTQYLCPQKKPSPYSMVNDVARIQNKVFLLEFNTQCLLEFSLDSQGNVSFPPSPYSLPSSPAFIWRGK